MLKGGPVVSLIDNPLWDTRWEPTSSLAHQHCIVSNFYARNYGTYQSYMCGVSRHKCERNRRQVCGKERHFFFHIALAREMQELTSKGLHWTGRQRVPLKDTFYFQVRGRRLCYFFFSTSSPLSFFLSLYRWKSATTSSLFESRSNLYKTQKLMALAITPF